mmetsp:Transcript_40610/g.71458  ORF Transcript_40610/g.71458 Transcript_40610/m.71458 type:complete len:638 (+) Transcript_40610:79-1992(+)
MATSNAPITRDGKESRANPLQKKLLDTDANMDNPTQQACGKWLIDDMPRNFYLLLLDCVCFAIFWYGVLDNSPLYGDWRPFTAFFYLDDTPFNCGLVGLLVAMILWRTCRCCWAKQREGVSSDTGAAAEEGRTNADTAQYAVPYTCGFTKVGDQELYLVATVHISPRSAKDAKDVVETVRPDVVMIELDEERLDNIRPRQPEPAKPEDLQAITLTQQGEVPEDGSWWWPFGGSEYQAIGEQGLKVLAQRALWNAEWHGKSVAGDVIFDSENEYGLKRPGPGARGSCVLVRRGGPPSGETPSCSQQGIMAFANKAHIAARDGAVALLIINDKNSVMPAFRIGGGTLSGELLVARHTCSMGFPPIPVLLLDHKDGDRLRYLAEKNAEAETGRIRAEFKVMDDNYPRKTLRRELCQTCTMFFSGIGILYGVIRCFKVEVGAEFTEAEQAATSQGVPCVCIDVNIQQLCGSIACALLPTPCNIVLSAWSWLALPRCLFQALFPPMCNIDHIGSMALHAFSFSCRVWVAFVIAGLLAGQVMSRILNWFSKEAAEATIELNPQIGKGTAVDDLQLYILNGIMMYMLPCIYGSILAARDEAMYRGIAAQARKTGARRMVAVAGAAHTNGILKRCRDRGFGSQGN